MGRDEGWRSEIKTSAATSKPSGSNEKISGRYSRPALCHLLGLPLPFAAYSVSMKRDGWVVLRRARLQCFIFRTRRFLLIYNARLLDAVSSLLSAILRFLNVCYDVC